MPTLPNLAIFCCEACGKQLTTDERMGAHLFPWKRRLAIEPNGTCSACHGDSWILSVVYSETTNDIGPTLAGLGLEAVTGFGFSHSTTATNQRVYSHIPAATVAELNEDPRSRMLRISEFVTAIERQKMIDGGARVCAACDALFAPVSSKPWTLEGYCSKSCFAESYGDSTSHSNIQPKADSQFRPTVQVKCHAGHSFEVLASFRGMVRPCPHCGIKTRISDGNSLDDQT